MLTMEISVEINEKGDSQLIRAVGEIDLYTSPRLRAAIMKAVQNGKKEIAVDLSEVRYMDSSGVATLIEGLRAARARKISFVLIRPSKAVMKVLELSRLDAVFTIR